MNHPTSEYDVAILGGAFSGASAGVLLKRANPDLRVLIIEKSEVFDRKVGESTSEVAGCFLSKVLHLHSYLAREHVTKHGLRMWFTGEDNECMGRCSEIGSFYQVRLPTFQIDRSKLDLKILDTAVGAGCELWRPANVRTIELGGAGENRLEVKIGGEMRNVRAKWLIDASGKAALIARKNKTFRKLDEHPTNSAWARFRGAKDFDGWELAQKLGDGYSEALPAARGTATNHLMGRGWWCWIIPLADGDVSAGLTWDPRLFDLPAGGTLPERLKAHLISHPVGREIFGEAEPIEKDTRIYSHLPYYSEQVAGDGWVSIGDAAGFMDPLYSQGLDYCAHGVYRSAKLIEKALGGECVKADVAATNDEFRTSYFRWYRALYREKYDYLGDAELMHAAYLLDVGTYFLGPVRLVYDYRELEFYRFPYFGVIGGIAAAFMGLYNRRFAAIARKRFAAGTYGKQNLDRRMFIRQGFTPKPGPAFRLIGSGCLIWLKAEIGALILPKVSAAKEKHAMPAGNAPASSGA